MRELSAIPDSIKMAPEYGDETNNENRVKSFRSQKKKTEQSSDRISKRTKTPLLRKTRSLLVLRTNDVGMSSSSVLTSHNAYNDDVTSITSSASTSSSSDGRGRLTRRRLPPLPKHESGGTEAQREGQRPRQQQQHHKSCAEMNLLKRTRAKQLLTVETEAKSGCRIYSGSNTCSRLKVNRSAEEEAIEVRRPLPVRLSCSPLCAADESKGFEKDAVSGQALQATASKRCWVSKAASQETSDKNRGHDGERHSPQIPFFLPLNHQIISSVDNDSEDEGEGDEVNCPRTEEDGRSSGNAPKSKNAKNSQLGKVGPPQSVQNYHVTHSCITWPKAQDISNENDNSSETALSAEILDWKEKMTPREERRTGASFQLRDIRPPLDQTIRFKPIGVNNENGDSGDKGTSAVTSEKDDDVTQMSSKDKLVLRLSNGSGEEGKVEWQGSRLFQSSSFPIPHVLSLHLLLQNHRLIPVSLFGSHSGDDLGMTFAKKSLLWRHFTETSGESFRPVATNENGAPLLGVFMVTHVAKGTVAEANGLIVGDIVVELNGLSVLRSSVDDVIRLLTSSGRRVDLVLARSRSLLDTMAERNNLNRSEESSDEVRRPQPADSFRGKEFPSKYPHRFHDEDNERDTKQGKQTNKEQHLAPEITWSRVSSKLPLRSYSMLNAPEEEEEELYIRHSSDVNNYPQNELFDPDFGWQKISAV